MIGGEFKLFGKTQTSWKTNFLIEIVGLASVTSESHIYNADAHRMENHGQTKPVNQISGEAKYRRLQFLNRTRKRSEAPHSSVI